MQTTNITSNSQDCFPYGFGLVNWSEITTLRIAMGPNSIVGNWKTWNHIVYWTLLSGNYRWNDPASQHIQFSYRALDWWNLWHHWQNLHTYCKYVRTFTYMYVLQYFCIYIHTCTNTASMVLIFHLVHVNSNTNKSFPLSVGSAGTIVSRYNQPRYFYANKPSSNNKQFVCYNNRSKLKLAIRYRYFCSTKHSWYNTSKLKLFFRYKYFYSTKPTKSGCQCFFTCISVVPTVVYDVYTETIKGFRTQLYNFRIIEIGKSRDNAALWCQENLEAILPYSGNQPQVRKYSQPCLIWPHLIGHFLFNPIDHQCWMPLFVHHYTWTVPIESNVR